LWTTPLGFRFVLGTPVVANGVVYAATEGAFAMRAKTGEILWSYPLGMVNTDPIVVNGVVYVGDFDGNIYAFGCPPRSPS
jgi:outer membrane protein assembly factor BamB